MSVGKSVGLDVHGADIEELVEDHKEEVVMGNLLNCRVSSIRCFWRSIPLKKRMTGMR